MPDCPQKKRSNYELFACDEQTCGLFDQSSRSMNCSGESDPESAPDQVFASLFQHFRDNKEFYTTLYKCGQTQVIINTIKNKLGMYMDLSSAEAYGKSCFAYGLFGWINEWVLQGMQEEPDTLSRLFFEEVKTVSSVIGALSDSSEKQM